MGCVILCLGHLKDAEVEIAKVLQSRQEAEQQNSASKVKMEVLSNYFKDKEKELMRFVGSLGLWTTEFCYFANLEFIGQLLLMVHFHTDT